MKKYLYILFVLTIIAPTLRAQQMSFYSQYMHNRYALNPAVAGSTDGMTIGISYRQMWTGLQDAPSMSTLYGHTQLNGNIGIGGRVFKTNTGPQSKAGVEGTYAYHFNISKDIKLSLGLSAILTQSTIDRAKLDMKDENDKTLNTGSENLIVPDATFGAYMYSKKFYFGLVAAQLMPMKVDFKGANLENKQERHYFAHAGYNFEINNSFSIEPSAMCRYIEAGAFQLDANLKFVIKQMFWFGGSYRLNDAAVAMIGVQTGNFMFGYSYDYVLSDINNFSNGSHELVLMLKIGGKDKSLF